MSIIEKIKLDINPLDLGTLLDINTRCFGGSSSLSDDDLRQAGLDPEVYRAIHNVLSQDGMDALADIRTIANRAKRIARQSGMHTPFRGFVLIPNGKVSEVNSLLENERVEFQKAVTRFLDGYNGYKIDFAEKYPKLAEKFEYPSVEKLARVFHFKWFWRAFEVPSTLPADIARQEGLERQNQGREILIRFVQDAIKELIDRITSLSEQFDKGTLWRKNSLEPIVKSIQRIGEIGGDLIDAVPELREILWGISETLNGVDLNTMEVEATLENVIEPLETETQRLIEF